MASTAQTREEGFPHASVPVLMYHSIAETSAQVPAGQSAAYSVRTSDFQTQLQALKASGRTVVPLTRLSSGSAAPSRSAVLTFDDGCETDYLTALPCLQTSGVTATFFLSTANIGTPGYLTWPQVREMHAAGMELGSHSHDHIPLTPLSSETARQQLLRSKSLIEDRIGAPVISMSAPFGFLNNTVASIARELGYRSICSSLPRMARCGDTTIPRIAIMHSTSAEKFQQIVNGDWRSYVPSMIRTALAYVPRHILLYLRPTAPGIRELKRPA
jgi:peptidoglycan/xylan/chitin deacetylase (PgdA/CDA1 family)